MQYTHNIVDHDFLHMGSAMHFKWFCIKKGKNILHEEKKSHSKFIIIFESIVLPSILYDDKLAHYQQYSSTNYVIRVI